MKMQVLMNSEGQITAMFERPQDDRVWTEPEVSEEEGEELVEVELPDEYRKMSAPESIERLQADIQAKRLKIKHKTQ
jgi:hypothetical protein